MADRIPELVFISYSRKDQHWLEEIENQLSYLVRGGVIKTWIDCGEIETGDRFTVKIMEAIDTCSAAIILVSPHFQNSPFIMQHELPRLLRHADNGELQLFWVFVADCPLVDDLDDYHSVNESMTPLIAMTDAEVNSVLARMARTLRSHVLDARREIRLAEDAAREKAEPEAQAQLLREEQGDGTKVTISEMQRPGAIISGSVKFSGGESAEWWLDQMG